jgi:hypothetical protein
MYFYLKLNTMQKNLEKKNLNRFCPKRLIFLSFNEYEREINCDRNCRFLFLIINFVTFFLIA